MIIKSLELKNIRSYTNEKIIFPEGSILLSGDIGSGKTTILSAIEFALFGLSPDLTGGMLLRNGSKEGFVKLKFLLKKNKTMTNETITNNNLSTIKSLNTNHTGYDMYKEYLIQRNLKKNKTSIVQTSGFLEENNSITELTPSELRSKIFELLGYPQSLSSKSKNLIYRFTVYTSQESMKQILFEQSEERLETIRRLFNIDKYKRIRENSTSIIRELRQEKKFLETKYSDLESKKQLLNHKIQSEEKVSQELKKITVQMNNLKENFEKQKKIIKELEEQKELINKKEQELNSKKQKKQFKEENLNNLEIEIKQDTKKLEELSKELDHQDKKLRQTNEELYSENSEEKLNLEKENFEKLEKLLKEKRKYENFLHEINSKKTLYSEKIKDAKINVSKIESLKECPFCKQKVTEIHKQSIEQESNELIQRFSSNIQKLEDKKLKIEEGLKKINTNIEEIQKLKSQFEIKKIKKKQYEELKNSVDNKKQRLKLINNEIKIITEEINSSLKEKVKFDNKEYEVEKENFEILNEKLNNLKIKQASYSKELEGIGEVKKILETELEEKKNALKKSKSISSLQNWLEEYLLKISVIIEKRVLSRIHYEFNELFKVWFEMLISDDVLNVSIDDSFNPIIYQNGYESEISSLSGGEKTAIAFSYRLALNKVVNDVLTHINTKNLLILDEPTDGFSSEQLDRVREVLDRINVKQLILVSHDQKVESFVDNILRIAKAEHNSKVF